MPKKVKARPGADPVTSPKLSPHLAREGAAGRLAILIVVVAGVVLFAHGPALESTALSFDDQQYLLNNYLVQNPSWASATQFLAEVQSPSTVDGYYQPLAMMSLMLDAACGGSPENLAPFHRTSLALHVANTALIIVLLYALVGNPWAAAMAGLLFGVHPMAVEPIAWVGERKTLLATFFALWSLLSYVRYVQTGRRTWYAAGICAFVLALMSKPTVTPLPLLLLLLDFWPLRRLSRRAVIEKVPFLVVAGISAAVTYISQKSASGVYHPVLLSPLRPLLILCHNIVLYPMHMLWPVHLSSYYPFPEPMSLSQPMILAGIVGTAGLIVLLIVSLRWTRVAATGWLFFFLAILPAMNMIGFTKAIAFDKYAYFPAIGILLILAALVAWLWERGAQRIPAQRWHVAISVVVLMLCGLEVAATRAYGSVWKDSEGLFQYMLAQSPHDSYLHDNLGTIMSRQGRLDDAIKHHLEALKFQPEYPEAHYNLGNALAQQGRLEEAIEHYRAALKTSPRYAEAHDNLAVALARVGDLDGAAAHSAEALRLKPVDPEIHDNRAGILMFLGKLDEAIGHYNEALRLNPNYALAHTNLGYALTRQGQLDEAVRHFETAIRLVPGLAKAHKGLGLALERQGRVDAAVREYLEALRLNPEDGQLRGHLDELRRR